MGDLIRIQSIWGGWKGAPGYSNFYGSNPADAATLRNAVVAFWAAMQASMPSGLTITTPPSGAVIDEATGELSGSWSVGVTEMATGSDSGSYPSPAGACIRWNTGAFSNGRQVRGRTFLVPIGPGNFDSDGTLGSAFISGTTTKATAMITAASDDFVVWARPHPGAADGGHFAVTNAFVPDKVVVLTSRRD